MKEAETEGDASLGGLEYGAPVVHQNHGVALFRGLETVATPSAEDGAPPTEREYLVLEYRGGDKLYVPADQADRVRPFIGPVSAAGGGTPALDRLRGQGWAKAVARARREADGVAEELLRLYAARAARTGHAYGPDTPEQAAVEAAFPHEETPDQLAAIADVKRDLEAPRPMDRLLVGDVGYGKTEVAVRATFKVAREGRQVAVLCPTSVLAAQHFQTFQERLGGRGVRIALLSRFVAPEEQQAVLVRLAAGEVDVAIGTHRLLSEDVAFRDLGFVVVDEEQRFGVAHKERLKELRETVDVLTMTATPIPRTLSLAAAGVLDVSVISDPPKGRTPVDTTVQPYDDGLVRDAILREVGRGGQAYYLHNRVENIADVAAYLEGLAPAARFRVAHGQMGEDELEDAVVAFYQGEADVLVCTTIIETGLDVPNANTLIADDADRLGLAQLYQLRGRVGRSETQAYALLLFRRPEAITPEAAERLEALRRFTAPGSGYQIAERDLQLRGAGKLLGLEQSGASAVGAVGYELFVRLLDRALAARRGAKPGPGTTPLPAVEVPGMGQGLPEAYVPDSSERLGLYARIASLRSEAEIASLREELIARYGPPPPTTEALLRLARMRLRCREAGVASVAADASEGGQIVLTFRKGARLSAARIAALQQALDARGSDVTLSAGRVAVRVAPSGAADAVEEVVDALARARARRRKEKAQSA
ncbi:MAG TPA: DEAD/DEAH box helicase [Armatimonadaceae bacterium]|nr:DEAD/DEAH box helicase [Armatimonadaceae bacterium]